jgi:hypothetical protein
MKIYLLKLQLEKVNVEFVSNVFSVNNNKIIQCIVREKLADRKPEQLSMDNPDAHYRLSQRRRAFYSLMMQ